MPRALRISLVLVAAIAAVLAFVVLRPDDDSTVADPQATPGTGGSPAVSTPDGEATPAATPTPTPKPVLLTVGAPRRLTVSSGETVTFRVRHDSDEELHVHGYDIARPLPAGKTVTVRFRAELEGIFEIELERSHTPLGSLQVEP